MIGEKMQSQRRIIQKNQPAAAKSSITAREPIKLWQGGLKVFFEFAHETIFVTKD